MNLDFTNKINLLEIKENDCLVFTFNNSNPPTDEIIEYLKDFRNNKLPQKTSMLILPHGMNLSLLSEEEMGKMGWYRK